MNQSRRFSIFLLCLGLIFLGKEATKVDANDVRGETTSADGKVFRNELFDLSVTKLDDWYAQSTKELLQHHEMSVNILADDNSYLQAVIRESLQASLPLFGFYRYASGTPTSKNAIIRGIAENISLSPGIKKGCDYLYHVKQLMTQSHIGLNFSDECLTKNINGSEFGYYNAGIIARDREIKQEYYACIKGTYAISIVQSYSSPEEKLMVDEILDTLKVECN